MEQVAMYMAALPCPPLPLIVKQAISEDEDKECYKNSHDLIATLLLGAMSQGNCTLNEKRKEKQLQLTNTLLQKLQAVASAKESGSSSSSSCLDQAYTACSEFTAGYVCAFMNLDVAVSFMPLDHVQRGDVVHKACCSWHKAQEIILAGASPSSSDSSSSSSSRVDALMKTDFSHLSYSELLGLHCARFIGKAAAATGGGASG